jgi:neutral ceramidase
MKRFGIILGSILGILVVIFILSTSSVEDTPFYKSDYYKKTEARVDSLKSAYIINNDSLKAGFAKISITPGMNYPEDKYEEGKFRDAPLAGYGARKGKPATGVHDSIFVKAAALKINDQVVVIVGADLLIMPPNIIDEVTIRLAQKGIQRNQIFYSASHSHSSLGGWGPGFIGEQFAGKENPNLSKWLILQITKVVTTAIADLKPARIGTGTFNAGTYTRNRLIGDAGTKNSDFAFISIEQIGIRKAVIGSFSAHSTTLGADNMMFSADYPGYWERKMESTSVDLAIFCAGSVGSQSPSGEGKGFDKPKLIGESLADSLNTYLHKVVLQDKASFSALSLKVVLPEYHIRLTPKINLASWASEKLMPVPQNVYLQALRIGNLIWITTPSDFSGEYALQIKNGLAAKGFGANISSFNGSYVGYIIPGRYFYLDEYEPKIMGWFGPNMGEYTVHLIRRMTDIITQTARK